MSIGLVRTRAPVRNGRPARQTPVEVVLVALVADVATDMAERGTHLGRDALALPTAILLIAAALKLAVPDHRAGA